MGLQIVTGLRYRTTDNRIVTLVANDDGIKVTTCTLEGRKIGGLKVVAFNISDAVEVSERLGYRGKSNIFLHERLYWVSDNQHTEMLVVVSKNGDRSIKYNFSSNGGTHIVPRERSFYDCEGIEDDVKRIYEKYKGEVSYV